MRQGSCLLAVAFLGWLSPALCAQYSYPAPYPYPNPYANPYAPSGYAPMPTQPMPYGYGYQGQMMMRPQYYAPNPMMARPVYYYPAATQTQPAYGYQSAPPRVYNYGTLQEEASAPSAGTPQTSPPPTQPAARQVSGLFKKKLPPTAEVVVEGCGPAGCPSGACATGSCATGACPTGGCSDGCEACRSPVPIPLAPPHPCGHFIGMVGASFLVPYPETRTAYTTTSPAGASTTTNFTEQMYVASFASLGYVFHNGFGVRGDFLYLHGNSNASTSNGDPLTTITTPGSSGFQITSPSAALTTGIGVDQFEFSRSFDFKIADLEIIKEFRVFDLFLTFGAGVRYAYIAQGYSAGRSNPGGTDPTGTIVVSSDKESLNFLSRFEGLGPTLSFEAVHPILGSCFSFYGNVRASTILGEERFNENHSLYNTTTTLGALPVATSINNSNETVSNRTVTMLDLEMGIQAGRRFGPCYVYGRVGAVYGRWWDVGNPLGSSGNLDLVGGALKFGIIY